MQSAARFGMGLSVLMGVGGCIVGEGKGSAKGPLWILACTVKDEVDIPYGTEEHPENYDLKPTFFAGDPIEDISQGSHTNRLRLRMQTHGTGQEDDDTLTFDIENSYEVARCLRHRTLPNGDPDWDSTSTVASMNGHLPVIPSDSSVWCDWSDATTDADAGAPADGGTLAPGPYPRMHFSSEGFTKAWLIPSSTCPTARAVGIGRAGWIRFEQFGSAVIPEVLGADFKVNFGETLKATFHVELQDDRVRSAEEDKEPVPRPRLGGVLDGSFEFILDRGRALQPFP